MTGRFDGSIGRGIGSHQDSGDFGIDFFEPPQDLGAFHPSPQADIEHNHRDTSAPNPLQGITPVGESLQKERLARHHPSKGVADRLFIIDHKHDRLAG